MSLLGELGVSLITGAVQSIFGGATGGPRGLTAFLSEVQTPSVGDWIAYMGRSPTPQEILQYGLAGRVGADVYASGAPLPELFAAVPGRNLPAIPMPPALPVPTFPGGGGPLGFIFTRPRGYPADWPWPPPPWFPVELAIRALRNRGLLAKGDAKSIRGAAGKRQVRRMNPLNPHALRRALARTHRFHRFVVKSGIVRQQFRPRGRKKLFARRK